MKKKKNKFVIFLFALYILINIVLVSVFSIAVFTVYMQLLTVGYIFKYEFIAITFSALYSVSAVCVSLPILLIPNFLMIKIYTSLYYFITVILVNFKKNLSYKIRKTFVYKFINN